MHQIAFVFERIGTRFTLKRHLSIHKLLTQEIYAEKQEFKKFLKLGGVPRYNYDKNLTVERLDNRQEKKTNIT